MTFINFMENGMTRQTELTPNIYDNQNKRYPLCAQENSLKSKARFFPSLGAAFKISEVTVS